jgi:serine/threonine protein kinase
MAPEMLQQKGYGRKIDIWSLGCCLIEMASGSHPWKNVTNIGELMTEFVNQRTPEVPKNLSDEAKDFISMCL